MVGELTGSAGPDGVVRLQRRWPMRAAWMVVLVALSGCAESMEAASDKRSNCRMVGEASCKRALACNQTFTDETLCTNLFVGACCESDASCDEAVDGAAWSTCVSDIEAASCETFSERNPPASCASLYGN